MGQRKGSVCGMVLPIRRPINKWICYQSRPSSRVAGTGDTAREFLLKSEPANAAGRTPAASLASLSPPRISRTGCRLLCADKSAKGPSPLFLDPSFSLQMQKERHSGVYRAARDGQ